MEDKKEEVKAEVKKEKKAKPKKEKKVIPDFDKIDVTTATEDEIIKSGIRKVVKTDIICYIFIFILIVLLILPPALRILVPRPITEVEREIAYVDLSCYKTIVRDGNEFSAAIYFHYRDGSVSNVEINHTLNLSDESYSFKESDDLKDISGKGISIDTDEENKTIYKIDFANNPELINNEVLMNYAYNLGREEEYMDENKYSCTAKSKVEKELVDVNTGKKIED